MKRIFFRKKTLVILFFISIFSGFLIYKDTTMPKVSKNFPEVELKTEKKEISVGIISDTHIPGRVKSLPKEIFEVFKNVDLIIHAGDIENLETLKELEKIAPVFAVKGNTDLKETKEKLSEGISLRIYNFKIGITHCPNSFWLICHLDTIGKNLTKNFAKKKNFDILIFGHHHRPYLKELNFKGKKILLINPGSPTLPFLSKPSIAILKITRDSFKGEIINLK